MGPSCGFRTFVASSPSCFASLYNVVSELATQQSAHARLFSSHCIRESMDYVPSIPGPLVDGFCSRLSQEPRTPNHLPFIDALKFVRVCERITQFLGPSRGFREYIVSWSRCFVSSANWFHCMPRHQYVVPPLEAQQSAHGRLFETSIESVGNVPSMPSRIVGLAAPVLADRFLIKNDADLHVEGRGGTDVACIPFCVVVAIGVRICRGRTKCLRHANT